jgi:Response regulators consisting of a CheY-like receiver domain and a winged-helix DNA-binding domain
MPSNEARVLIVEDNDALRVMLFTILRHQPLAVDTASTALEALDKVVTCDYKLILLDLDLPSGDALRFLRDFRIERPTSTSFILAVRDPKKEIALEPGSVNAVITKPIEIDTLAEVVRECALVVPPPEDPLECPPAENSRPFRYNGDSQLAN